MHESCVRKLVFIGSSLDDLRGFPEKVRKEIGFTFYQIQIGKMPHNAKYLKGFDHGVMEIISDFNKNTYRAVYALKLGESIYVLHAFQKKSKTGIKTPEQEIKLIERRLLLAKQCTSKT